MATQHPGAPRRSASSSPGLAGTAAFWLGEEVGRGLRGRAASRRRKAGSRGLGSEGDRITFGVVGKGGVGRKSFSRRKQTRNLPSGRTQHFARGLCSAGPAASHDGRGGDQLPSSCLQLLERFWFSLLLLGFCFVLFCLFFFGLACFLFKRGEKKVCNYFLQSSHYISVNNKEEIL